MIFDIGGVLKKYREQSKITVDEVSEYLSSHGKKSAKKTIYGWEKNRSEPDAETLMLLCQYYKIDDIFLVFGLNSASNSEIIEIKGYRHSLLKLFDQLNVYGKKKLLETAEDLVQLKKYTESEISDEFYNKKSV